MNTAKISKVTDLPRVDKGRVIYLDTETDVPLKKPNKMADRPFMVLVGIDEEDHALLWDAKTKAWLTDNLPKADRVIGHKVGYDIHTLNNGGMPLSFLRSLQYWCTMVHETLLDEHRYVYGLDALCQDFFGITKKNDELLQWLADRFGGKPTATEQMHRIKEAPKGMTAYYGIGDIEMTRMLYKRQLKEIPKQDLGRLSALEMDVLKVLVTLEKTGVPVDIDKAGEVGFLLEEKLEEVFERIENMVGFRVNPRSGKQMEKAFDALGIRKTFKKGKTTPSFDKGILQSIEHDFCRALLESRNIRTIIDSFISSFQEHVWKDGRIHTDFNQTKSDEYGTRTGRLSSSGPNLQQVPKRDGELAPLVRSLFAALTGYSWISADWEQFEFRVFAHYTADPKVLAAFRDDPTLDYHQVVADLTGLKRNPYAKQLNLGLVFGMGEGLMAQKCALPYTIEVGRGGKEFLRAGTEAQRIFQTYHHNLPSVKPTLKRAEQAAARRGWVRTIYGRRMRFPGGANTYKAAGLVFQGTSADIMKKKLVELDAEFFGTGVEFILPVHDEFNFLCPDEMLMEVKPKVKEILEDVPDLVIPILSDVGVGPNWWEASK